MWIPNGAVLICGPALIRGNAVIVLDNWNTEHMRLCPTDPNSGYSFWLSSNEVLGGSMMFDTSFENRNKTL